MAFAVGDYVSAIPPRHTEPEIGRITSFRGEWAHVVFLMDNGDTESVYLAPADLRAVTMSAAAPTPTPAVTPAAKQKKESK